MWRIKFTNNAVKDMPLLRQAHLDDKTKNILNRMRLDPFIVPPPFEKLGGKLKGYYSRRINIQHRLVYSVNEESQTIIVHRMWSHYE